MSKKLIPFLILFLLINNCYAWSLGGIVSSVTDTVSSATSTVSSVVSSAYETVSNAVSNVVSTASSLISSLNSAALHVISSNRPDLPGNVPIDSGSSSNSGSSSDSGSSSGSSGGSSYYSSHSSSSYTNKIKNIVSISKESIENLINSAVNSALDSFIKSLFDVPKQFVNYCVDSIKGIMDSAISMVNSVSESLGIFSPVAWTFLFVVTILLAYGILRFVIGLLIPT